MGQLIDAEWMNLSGNDKNKITGKKYQPVMSVTGLNDQGLSNLRFSASSRRLEESTKLYVGWILYIDTKWIKMLFTGVSNYHDTFCIGIM